jgi:CheY-like chemotaxis protein
VRFQAFNSWCFRGIFNQMLKVNRPIEILLVEDSPSDTELTIEALREGTIGNRLSHVEDGVEAMDFLAHREPYTRAPRPDLILLDLNLPRKDGRELLAELKADPDLQTIPVVVLTTSKADQDVLRAYQLQANCYVTKPVDFIQFVRVLRSIEHFWLEVATLPTYS